MTPNQLDRQSLSKKIVENMINHIDDRNLKRRIKQFDIRSIRLALERYRRNVFNADNAQKINLPAILPISAIFNHSCYPNLSFTFHNGTMRFITNRIIKKGEELTDFYCDISMNTEDRRKHLLDNYGFFCKCDRCENKINPEPNMINNILLYREQALINKYQY